MVGDAVGDPARRLSSTVFVGVAFGMVALYAALTAAPLVAEDLTGSRTWSGLPGAAAIAGTSTGTALLAAFMAASDGLHDRRDHRHRRGDARGMGAPRDHGRRA